MIDRHARKKLRESLGRDGLVETVIVNRRTGHVVSGHQRLGILDEESNGKPYSLDVAVIDVDLSRERELLVRMNNPTSQGAYDFDKLEQLLRDSQVKLESEGLGFDDLDLAVMFPEKGQADLSSLFDKSQDAAQTDIDEMKRWKAEKRKKDRKGDSAEFWVAFVALDSEQIERFLERLGLDTQERFHDLSRLATLIGLDLSEPEKPGLRLEAARRESPPETVPGDPSAARDS